ncbi:MAG TPA: tagaturonate reductase [Bacillota bacterium]|nr:tagaturonate reductase [Bacillota bacterium]
MANEQLPLLNCQLLKEKYLGSNLADYAAEILNYPEKVIQFGEGNFLRAFVDWMIHQMNKSGVFKGRVVVVQPIAQGRVRELNAQDGLYTLLLRGMQEGKVIDNREIIPAISRGLSVVDQWEEVLKCAENPEIEFVVSNTTEAGISYRADDEFTAQPPVSFPAKMTVYLYRRFQHFNGDPSKGLVIIPCELIDRNGDNLKKIVLTYADQWNLPEEFKQWVKTANHFLNTLVDRIVTGYPFNESAQLEAEFGYRDQNLNAGELFHLWVIEGDSKLSEKLPFHQVGLNVKWVSDMTPYRTRKVRILNGAHTSTVALACLSNIDLVRDAVSDDNVGKFLQDILFEEIIPTLDLDTSELYSFAKAVLERFNNPFIDHKWFDIALNSTSKFETRVMPSLVTFIKRKGVLPKRLTFSLAALIAFYRGTEIRNNKLVGHRANQEYFIQDDLETLQFFSTNWQAFDSGKIKLEQLVSTTLNRFWPEGVKEYPQLVGGVTEYLSEIVKQGITQSVTKCS